MSPFLLFFFSLPGSVYLHFLLFLFFYLFFFHVLLPPPLFSNPISHLHLALTLTPYRFHRSILSSSAAVAVD